MAVMPVGGPAEPLSSRQSWSPVSPLSDSDHGVSTPQRTPPQALAGLKPRAVSQANARPASGASDEHAKPSTVGSPSEQPDVFAHATESVRAALRRASDAPPEISDRFAAILADRSRAAAARIAANADDIAAALILLHKHEVSPRSFTSMFARQFAFRRSEADVLREVTDLVRWCTRERQFDKSLFRSITGMQAERGMPAKQDVDALVGWCSDEDGELDHSLLSSITGMQNGKGMLAKQDFDKLIGWCTDEHGKVDRALLSSITGMQNGKGMLAKEDFDALIGWCTDKHGKLDRPLLSSITGMQNGRGMLAKRNFDKLIGWCTDEQGKLDRLLLSSITSMQSGKGMLAKRDFDKLIGWCTDEHGKLDRSLLRSVTGMQNGRGMLAERGFVALKRWCTDEDGKLDRSLLRSITGMQNGKGIPSRAEFEGALAIRAEIRALVERGDFSTYSGNAGQIRFLKQRADRGAFAPASLRAFSSLLDPAWRTALNWSWMDWSQEQAARVLSTLSAQIDRADDAPVAPVIDGVRHRVAVDAMGRVADWFSSDGLPRRLQQFSGRLVGYTAAVQDDIPVLILRLKAPLGYAVYSFSAYLPNQSEVAEIEIVMRDGLPDLFRLWRGKELPRTIHASNALLFGERPDAAFRSINVGEFELEMVAVGPSVEDQADQKLLALTLQSILSARYGREEADRIVAVFSELDAWTQDEGLSEQEAYSRLDEEFGISQADYAGYKSALRELLSAHGLGAQGFAPGDHKRSSYTLAR